MYHNRKPRLLVGLLSFAPVLSHVSRLMRIVLNTRSFAVHQIKQQCTAGERPKPPSEGPAGRRGAAAGVGEGMTLTTMMAAVCRWTACRASGEV